MHGSRLMSRGGADARCGAGFGPCVPTRDMARGRAGRDGVAAALPGAALRLPGRQPQQRSLSAGRPPGPALACARAARSSVLAAARMHRCGGRRGAREQYAGLPASRRAACCTHEYASGEGWVRWVGVGSCVLSGCAGVVHVAMQSVGRGSSRGGPPAPVAATAVCMALLRPSTDRHDTMAILGPFLFWRWWCHARLQKWPRMAATCRQEV